MECCVAVSWASGGATGPRAERRERPLSAAGGVAAAGTAGLAGGVAGGYEQALGRRLGPGPNRGAKATVEVSNVVLSPGAADGEVAVATGAAAEQGVGGAHFPKIFSTEISLPIFS